RRQAPRGAARRARPAGGGRGQAAPPRPPRGGRPAVVSRLGRAVLPSLAAALAIGLAWITLARLMQNPTLLPGPLAVGGTLGSLLGSGALLRHAGASVGRIFLAWSLAVAVAVPLGVAMGRSERLGRLVRPVRAPVRAL